jgi:hypothetical protein
VVVVVFVVVVVVVVTVFLSCAAFGPTRTIFGSER